METNPFSDILECELIITIMDKELESYVRFAYGFDDRRNVTREVEQIERETIKLLQTRSDRYTGF